MYLFTNISSCLFICLSMTCSRVQDHMRSVLQYENGDIKKLKLSVCFLLLESACILKLIYIIVCELSLIRIIVLKTMEYIEIFLISRLHIMNTHTRNNISEITHEMTNEIKENSTSFRWK